MKKYVDTVVLAIFVTKLATPAFGCDSNSACGDEAINLAFAILGGIVFTSIVMIVIYFCCLKHAMKRRESRGNSCDGSQRRWRFGDNEYTRRETGYNRNCERNFGDDEYEWGDYCESGRLLGNYSDDEKVEGSFVAVEVPREGLMKVHTPRGDVLC